MFLLPPNAERAITALREVGLGDHINKRPNELSAAPDAAGRHRPAHSSIDPEILLADEPTGALDSTTSVQIMKLLTQIADDRLVVMVTHDPELAEQYADRIVNLRDGVVVGDADPFDPSTGDMRVSEKDVKTSMSF